LHMQELISHEFSFDRLEDGLEVMQNKTEYYNKVMEVFL